MRYKYRDIVDEEPEDTRPDVSKAYAAAWVAQQKLHDAITRNCPGPHILVQHRDRRPAWCHQCGYAKTGVKVVELVKRGRVEGR